MDPSSLRNDQQRAGPTVLLTGGSGYVGGRLRPILEADGVELRCLARPPRLCNPSCPAVRRSFKGDVQERASLDAAMDGVEIAYYLIHLMGQSEDFERDDREAAANFAEAARQANVRRIIYLGGLGDDSNPNLSPHLRSRHEVGRILRESGVECIEFRASLVIGKGSLSFDLVRSLTHRLPIMICALALGPNATDRD